MPLVSSIVILAKEPKGIGTGVCYSKINMGTQCVNASIAQLCGIQSTLLLPVSNCSGYGRLAPRLKINLKIPIWWNPNPTLLTKQNEL